MLYFGGRQIINGTLTLGEWQKFSLYLIYVFIPMGQLGFIISLMAQAGASAERIFEILDTKNDVENKPGAVDVSTVEGRVEFRDVTFRYFQGSEPVLNDISFSAEPGQTLSLIHISVVPRPVRLATAGRRISARGLPGRRAGAGGRGQQVRHPP